ncbi:MAG: DUF6209 family protein [Byssovorax sp.]
MITKRSLSMVDRRTSVALLAVALAGCAGEAPCGGDACTGLDPVAAAPAPVPARAGSVTADFRAHLQPGAKAITFERINGRSGAPGVRPQDLTDLTVTQNGVAGSGPANSVELVTNTVGYNAECPAGYQTSSFCGNVTLRHFYGLALSDVHVQVTKVTDAGNVVIAGHGGINNDPSLHGLDASQGLWKYTSAGASSAGGVGRSPDNQATRDWVFANPDDADTWIYLRVVASLYPTLWYNPGYTTTQSAPLIGGQPAIIHYDYSRLTTCRGSSWSMTAAFFGRDLGSNTHNHTMTFPGQVGDTSLDVAFAVPLAGDTAVYFHNVDSTGCSDYDSSFSNNWHASSIDPSPVIHFNPSGFPYAGGTLKAGGPITVDYDLLRLGGCGSVDPYDRLPAGNSATLYYRFDAGAFTGVALTGSPYGVPAAINGSAGTLQVPPTITAPVGATYVEMYFQSGSCYDSNGGSNYVLTVSP